MSLPLVTIVTPSYNQGQFLERTILSVLNQDYPNIEYIVMDGGSNDESFNILKKYNNRISYWESKKDNGQSDAINKGWRMGKGIYCSYLNSDDTLLPDAVRKIVNAFEENRDVGVVYGDYTFVDTNDVVLEEGVGKPTSFRELLIHGQIQFIAQPSSFYRTDLIRRIGYIDQEFHLAMDYDLLVKLSQVSKMLYIPEKVSQFRLHTAAKTSSYALRHWHETLRVKWKYNKVYMIKSLMLYLRFRIFHMLPDSIKLRIRSKRNSVHDRMILCAKH